MDSQRAVLPNAGIILAALAMAVSGCQSHRPLLKAAFQDLTSETQQPSGAILQHNEIMSIAGMIPLMAPGTFVHFSDPDDATTAIGINPDRASFYLNCTFGNDSDLDQASLADMLEVRNAMRDYQRAQLTFLSEVDRAITQTVSEMSKSNPSSGATRDAIAALFNEYAKKMAQTRIEIFDSESKLIAAVRRPNLLVTQWSSAMDTSANVDVNGFGSGTVRSRASVDGYWILSGVRMRFLVVGSDIADIGHSDSDKPNQQIDPEIIRLLRAVSVTTFAIQSRKSLWVSESSELAAIRSKVTASVSDLAKLIAADALTSNLIQQLKADIDLAAARRSSLSNIGILQQPSWDLGEHKWKLDHTATPNGNGWMTIMAQSACMGAAADRLLPIVAKLRRMNSPGVLDKGEKHPPVVTR